MGVSFKNTIKLKLEKLITKFDFWKRHIKHSFPFVFRVRVKLGRKFNKFHGS